MRAALLETPSTCSMLYVTRGFRELRTGPPRTVPASFGQEGFYFLNVYVIISCASGCCQTSCCVSALGTDPPSDPVQWRLVPWYEQSLISVPASLKSCPSLWEMSSRCCLWWMSSGSSARRKVSQVRAGNVASRSTDVPAKCPLCEHTFPWPVLCRTRLNLLNLSWTEGAGYPSLISCQLCSNYWDSSFFLRERLVEGQFSRR